MSGVQCIRRPVCNRVARRLKNWEKRGRGLIERAYSLRVTRTRELVVLFSFVITTGRHYSATQIFAAGPRKYHRVQRLFFPFFSFFFFCIRLSRGQRDSYHQGSRPLRNFTDISTFPRQSSRSERSKVITRGKNENSSEPWRMTGTGGSRIALTGNRCVLTGEKPRRARSICNFHVSIFSPSPPRFPALFVSIAPIEYSMSLMGAFWKF